MRLDCRSFAVIVAMLVLATQPSCTQNEPRQEQTATLYPIKKTIPEITADGLDIPEQTLTVSDKNGWLVVSLVAAPDELEWRVVLAKIDPNIKPAIDVHPQLPLFSVQYGSHFIRESLGRLRVLRQTKDFDGASAVIGDAPAGDTICSANNRLFVVQEDDWCWVCTSPKHDQKTVDTIIRFQHVKLKHGHGGQGFADGKFSEVFCGDARCHDEGDLLVARRTTSYVAQSIVAHEAIKKNLIGQTAPDITSSANYPADSTIDLEQLKGKVVLIDFWAQWCGPCVKKLPEANALYEKYSAKGLAVVGVHSCKQSDGLEKFFKTNPVGFPFVVDDGETEKRYAISGWPTYFLIGRDGKICWGFESKPPSEELIESELAKQQ